MVVGGFFGGNGSLWEFRVIAGGSGTMRHFSRWQFVLESCCGLLWIFLGGSGSSGFCLY